MTTKEQMYALCKVARKYPLSWFWVFTCAAFAAGVGENVPAMAIVLFGQLGIVGHLAHRVWSPRPWEATTTRGRRDGRAKQ